MRVGQRRVIQSYRRSLDSLMSGSLEIEATDVVKIVLQFLKENSLTQSLQVLQEESQVALNIVDNVEALVSDVQQGRCLSREP